MLSQCQQSDWPILVPCEEIQSMFGWQLNHMRQKKNLLTVMLCHVPKSPVMFTRFLIIMTPVPRSYLVTSLTFMPC